MKARTLISFSLLVGLGLVIGLLTSPEEWSVSAMAGIAVAAATVFLALRVLGARWRPARPHHVRGT